MNQEFSRPRPTGQDFSRQRPSNQEFTRPIPSDQEFPRQRTTQRRPPTETLFNPTDFEPQRQQQQSNGGRQRLEVTEIRVRPQLAQDFSEEPINIDALRQVANRFRQRGSQQQ